MKQVQSLTEFVTLYNEKKVFKFCGAIIPTKDAGNYTVKVLKKMIVSGEVYALTESEKPLTNILSIREEIERLKSKIDSILVSIKKSGRKEPDCKYIDM